MPRQGFCPSGILFSFRPGNAKQTTNFKRISLFNGEAIPLLGCAFEGIHEDHIPVTSDGDLHCRPVRMRSDSVSAFV
jgi:hypothetical protein